MHSEYDYMVMKNRANELQREAADHRRVREAKKASGKRSVFSRFFGS
ncbi:hypothetical protein ACIBG8_20240 [Nonomuraea sp. NPDC050556]